MSGVILISCDGEWPGGFRCRGNLPTRESTWGGARMEAAQQGWHTSPNADFDLCPAHSRRREAARSTSVADTLGNVGIIREESRG